jgi:hypothetical protein
VGGELSEKWRIAVGKEKREKREKRERREREKEFVCRFC